MVTNCIDSPDPGLFDPMNGYLFDPEIPWDNDVYLFDHVIPWNITKTCLHVKVFLMFHISVDKVYVELFFISKLVNSQLDILFSKTINNYFKRSL